MKRKELLIVICVIAFGIIYNAVESGDFEIRFYEGCSISPRSLQDRKYPNDFAREELQYSYANIKKIEIHNTAGGIVVEKSTDNEDGIRVKPLVRVYHRSKEKAAKIEKTIKIVTRTSKANKKISLSIQPGEGFPYRRVRVHFKLVVPEGIELDLWNRYGDIDIDGCGKNISLDEKHGDISVKQAETNIKIRHGHGNVALRDINGRIELSSKHSRIGIKNAGELKLHFSHARVSINRVEKKTDIDYAAHSSIEMEDGNGFALEGRHTKIKLKKNAYAYIGIEGITAKTLDILTSHGSLDIAFDQVEERINIKNKHSRISLEYPPSVKPLFNINSKYGTIIDKTSVKYTILKEKNRMSLNNPEGKPEIIINNPYGTTVLKNSREEPKKPKMEKVETEEFRQL